MLDLLIQEAGSLSFKSSRGSNGRDQIWGHLDDAAAKRACGQYGVLLGEILWCLDMDGSLRGIETAVVHCIVDCNVSDTKFVNIGRVAKMALLR